MSNPLSPNTGSVLSYTRSERKNDRKRRQGVMNTSGIYLPTYGFILLHHLVSLSAAWIALRCLVTYWWLLEPILVTCAFHRDILRVLSRIELGKGGLGTNVACE